MVIVDELANAFWGVTLNEGKRYMQKMSGEVHVSMAALEPGSNKGDDGPVSVMIRHDNSDFMLCSLSSGHVFQQTLDLKFNVGEEVTFFLKGKGVVHLTGYILTGEEYDSDTDEDFLPASSFAESDDSSTSDDDEEVAGGSKKRKKQPMDMKSKKPKVEIVDEDEEDDEEEEDSDLDDDDEEETPTQKKSKKKKQGETKQDQPTPSVKTQKQKKGKNSQKAAESVAASKEPDQSASTETGEKKKKKKKRNKKKNQESGNSAKMDAGSSSEKEGSSKPLSAVIEGVTIEDLKVGHGPEAKTGSTVHVYYTGRLTNGKLFDSRNSGKPLKLKLGKKQVIKGWEIGIQGMKVGGRRKLAIPPMMGYGSQKVGDIPPNSTLHFEVELKAVS